MNQKQAASVWTTVRGLGFNAVARYHPRGQLQGEHVVEIEPGHDVHTADFRVLLDLCEGRSIDLSYGTSPRRVLVLS